MTNNRLCNVAADFQTKFVPPTKQASGPYLTPICWSLHVFFAGSYVTYLDALWVMCTCDDIDILNAEPRFLSPEEIIPTQVAHARTGRANLYHLVRIV